MIVILRVCAHRILINKFNDCNSRLDELSKTLYLIL